MYKRGSGILCHLSMLPNSNGIGDMGDIAYRFVDWLSSSGQRYWEVLPLNSLLGRSGDGALTPYGATSSFAGNILYISEEKLLDDGILLKKISARKSPSSGISRVDNFNNLERRKAKVLWQAFFDSGKKIVKSKKFRKFCLDHAQWLNDYALYEVISRFVLGDYREGVINHLWQNWPSDLRNKTASSISKVEKEFSQEILWVKFSQYLFFSQWESLRVYANKKDIEIIGDIPIYSHVHSADTWSHREQFCLDKHGLASFTGGTPPDCFSATGQNWGSPIYNWKQAKKDLFYWQRSRINHQLRLFDILRLDHYQGYISYWSIPANSLAMSGAWRDVPSMELFACLKNDQGGKPFKVIVEDLGALTPKARVVMNQFDFWGMNVLLYAFDSVDSTYLPFKHVKNSVCYIGTHDNNTALGHWKQAKASEKKYFSSYIGKKVSSDSVHWDYIRLALSSASNLVILQVQDLLGLDETSRTNDPSRYILKKDVASNWSYRLNDLKQLNKLGCTLKQLNTFFSR